MEDSPLFEEMAGVCGVSPETIGYGCQLDGILDRDLKARRTCAQHGDSIGVNGDG